MHLLKHANQNDALLAELDADQAICIAINQLDGARQRQQRAEVGRSLLHEAVEITQSAGMPITRESVTATLAGLIESAKVAEAQARAGSGQVHAALARYREAIQPVRTAAEKTLADLRGERESCIRQRDRLQLTRAESGSEALSTAAALGVDVDRLRLAGFTITHERAATVDRGDSAEDLNLHAHALGQQIARLEPFAVQQFIDMDSLAAVAQADGHTALLAAVSTVREAIGAA